MFDDLRADCGRCAALCCVAPAFAVSADFAIDKPAGQPCPNLRADFRCGIHDGLRERGFPGCAAYDCFGAGQHVVQVTFGGRDWRQEPEIAESMFAVFGLTRQLRQMLWYLTEALTLGPFAGEVAEARGRVERLAAGSPDDLAGLDVAARRREVGALLARVSEQVRAGVPDAAPDRVGADLVGSDLRGTSLRGAGLRGAYLIGADLTGADLLRADLLGADLRGAGLRGALLGEAIFLTQPQLDSARGDAATTVPAQLRRPAHW